MRGRSELWPTHTLLLNVHFFSPLHHFFIYLSFFNLTWALGTHITATGHLCFKDCDALSWRRCTSTNHGWLKITSRCVTFVDQTAQHNTTLHLAAKSQNNSPYQHMAVFRALRVSLNGMPIYQIVCQNNSLQQYLCVCVCSSVLFMSYSILFPVWDAAVHISLLRLFTRLI